jgi:hypothetical protein
MFLQILKKFPKIQNSRIIRYNLKNFITNNSKFSLTQSNKLYSNLSNRRNFCSKENDLKQEEPKSEVKKELEETEEKKKRLEKEERIRKLSEKYTDEELKILLEKEEDIEFMEIKPEFKRKLLRAKRISLLLNIPLALAIVFLVDYIFENNKEKKSKIARFVTLAFGYNLFFVAFAILVGYRNIVLAARYIPKEKAVEFTKLSALCKPYKVKENAENLKRMKPGMLTPHISLKNTKYNNIYSMTGIAEWMDRKLFNTLFPQMVQKKEKKKKLIKLF